VDLKDFATFNDTQLGLRNLIPPEMLSLGQRAIDIGGPLPVCYTFTAVMFVVIIVDVFFGEELRWRPTKWAKGLIYGTYGYVVLMLTIFHLSLGDLGISMILGFYEALLPYMLLFLFAFAFSLLLVFVGTIGILIESVVKKNKKNMVDALKGLYSCVVGGALTGILILSFEENRLPLVPDLAVSVGERD